jgi:hypothetical protein
MMPKLRRNSVNESRQEPTEKSARWRRKPIDTHLRMPGHANAPECVDGEKSSPLYKTPRDNVNTSYTSQVQGRNLLAPRLLKQQLILC